MKKKILIVIVLVVLGVLATYTVYQLTYDKEAAVIEYLENKYNQNFTMLSETDSTEGDYAYSFSPEQNNNIVFTAGKKKEQHIIPFLPPVRNMVFYDNYFEQSKSYIESDVLKQNNFILSDEKDINTLTDTIYAYMEEINTQLNGLGFDTTKYTCSIETTVTVDNREDTVTFYMLDRSKIYDQLYQLYYS